MYSSRFKNNSRTSKQSIISTRRASSLIKEETLKTCRNESQYKIEQGCPPVPSCEQTLPNGYCGACYCKPCTCKPSLLPMPTNHHSNCCCCCCCGHQDGGQNIPGGVSPIIDDGFDEAELPLDGSEFPSDGDSGGGYGSLIFETPDLGLRVRYKTLRDAYQALLKRMAQWGVKIEILNEIVTDPINKFYILGTEEAAESLEGLELVAATPYKDESLVSSGFIWIDNVLEEGSSYKYKLRCRFYVAPDLAQMLQAGWFYVFGGGGLAETPSYELPDLDPIYLKDATMRALWHLSIPMAQVRCATCFLSSKTATFESSIPKEDASVLLSQVLRRAGRLYLARPAKDTGGSTYPNAINSFKVTRDEFLVAYPEKAECLTLLGLDGIKW